MKKNIYVLALFSISFIVAYSQTNFNADSLVAHNKAYTLEFQKRALQQQNPARKSVNPQPVLMADSDKDGMDDAWETANGLNPLDAKDAWFDMDNDEVLNLFEFGIGSNPANSASPTFVTVPLGGNITTAISNASAGQVVRVQSGKHKTAKYQTFTAKNVMVQGGWNSTFTSRNPISNPTIIEPVDTSTIFYFNPHTGNSSLVIDGVHLKKVKDFHGAVCFIMQGNAVGKLFMKDCKIDSTITTFIDGGAMDLLNWGSSKSDVIIANTAVVNNVATGIYNQTDTNSIANWKLINVTVSNNIATTIFNGYGLRGFTLDNGTVNVDIINSISYANQKAAVKFNQQGGPITINASYSDFDLVSATTGAIYNPGVSVVNVSPQFVAPSASNFLLSNGSPCIDAGINLGIAYNGSAPEMGAYEYIISTDINEVNEVSLNIFPNPFSTTATIYFDKMIVNGKLRLINMLGQELKVIDFDGDRIVLENQNFAKGSYVIEVFSEGKMIAVKKIIVN